MKGFREASPRLPGERGEASTNPSQLTRRYFLTAMGSAATCLGLRSFSVAEENDISSSADTFSSCSPAPVPIPAGLTLAKRLGQDSPIGSSIFSCQAQVRSHRRSSISEERSRF